uniref:Acetylxylan esterase n=1 Tax=uncultured Bacillota bacterium TaxID=344338 RepID=A0A650ENE5_9FIRM|nr:acetylxylan esterase [uncultured Firmicutes bacterium]
MPVVDMSLEELKKYGGMNPCPPDIDEFWDRAIAEMEALDPQVELIPSQEFHTNSAECFDLYFTGVGGARVHAQYLRPLADGKKHPAVLQFHGYTGSCGDWCDKLKYVNNGMCAAAMDVRGQGGKSQDNSQVAGNTHNGHIIRGLEDEPEKLLFRQVFLDTALLARIVMSFEEVDETKVGAYGGSQGGALSVACACLTPNLNRIAVQYPFLCDYKRVWHMDLGTGAYAELKEFFRHTDPQHKKEEETFLKLGYIDLQHLAKRIRADVLWAVGLMDTTCPPSTQFAAYNKITAKKDLMVYPDFGHEGLPQMNDATFMYMEKMMED